jgi:FtsZ-interacting cell division protein ZipA
MEGLIFFVFLVIAGVSWAINFAKQQEMQQKRLEQQKQRRRGKPSMQVDDFLDEDEIEVVPGSRRGNERRPPADRRTRQRDDIWREQTRDPAASRSPVKPAPQRPAPKKQPPKPKAAPQQSSFPDRGNIPPQRQGLSGTRLASQPSGDLSGVVARSVAADLGEFKSGSAPLETTTRRVTPAMQLLAQLRQPGGVRNAIIIKEVLGRPVSERQ